MIHKVKIALFAGISFLGIAQAQAQDGQTGGQANSQKALNEGGMSDIVVTARRRNEGLLETPVAVTAFSAADLDRRSIQTLNEIQANTPSLIYESTGGNGSEARVFIRGVGNATANITAEQGVGIYIDGMYYARAQGALLENLDIASLEVLRGPQGTLFGRNTTGGAVLSTTAKPVDRVEGMVKLGYGNYLDWALKNVRQGGIITAHNAFRGGGLLDESNHNEDTKYMREFNLRFAQEPRLLSTIFPAGDGLLIGVVL